MSLPWVAIWKAVFLAGTASFALLALWVAVQGGRDVWSLFADLGSRRPAGRNPRRKSRSRSR